MPILPSTFFSPQRFCFSRIVHYFVWGVFGVSFFTMIMIHGFGCLVMWLEESCSFITLLDDDGRIFLVRVHFVLCLSASDMESDLGLAFPLAIFLDRPRGSVPP